MQQTRSKDICTAAKLGERRLFKVALPETARNHYIFFWLSGRALDSGQAERQTVQIPHPAACYFVVQIPLSLLFCFCFFVLYCCTAVVVLLYTHSGLVGCWWMGFSAVYCVLLLLYTHGGWVSGLIGTSTTHVAHHSETLEKLRIVKPVVAQPIHRLTCLRVEA